MGEEFVPFGSRIYWWLLASLVFGRAMDFLSTWIATPNLVLEANPLARKLGWRWGLILNVLLCCLFARWPLPAIVIATTSVLVASRNLQSAWLMRSMGEEGYRVWMRARILEAPGFLFFFCLAGQAILYAVAGAALLSFSHRHVVPLGIGAGLITYAMAVLVYTTLSVWRLKVRPR